jgi:small GTP-binding protein
MPTIGAGQYTLDLNGLSAAFWDTGGQERFRAFTAAYFREATVVIFAYSITSQQSLHGLKSFGVSVEQVLGDRVGVVVVGLKLDLDAQRAVAFDEAKQFCENKLSPKPAFVMEVSSLSGEGIQSFKDELR